MSPQSPTCKLWQICGKYFHCSKNRLERIIALFQQDVEVLKVKAGVLCSRKCN